MIVGLLDRVKMEEFREDLLIKTVKKHECLYNVKSADYRDNKTRQDRWDLIGKKWNISGNETKDCWERLRRSFSNVRNRRNKSKPTIITKKWKYEDLMAFLIPFMETKINKESDCSSSVTSTVSDVVSQESTCDASVKTIQSSDLVCSPSVETAESSDLACNDDTDIFFLNMARMTKQLPKVQQARIKLELSKLVLSAEIEYQETLCTNSAQNSVGTFQEITLNDDGQYFLNL